MIDAKKIGAALLVAAAAFGMTTSASAQDTKKKDGGDYGYWFKDDVLQAGADGASAPRIRVLVIRHKEGLMRPRVAFVTEMLKSVEGM